MILSRNKFYINLMFYLQELGHKVLIYDQRLFEKKISEPYIGHTLKVNPSERIINWVNENFKPIGNENIFYVTILDASITQVEFENKEAKNFDEVVSTIKLADDFYKNSFYSIKEIPLNAF